jgi:hypothetical protein
MSLKDTKITKARRLSSNIKIINEFLIYMKSNGSSERTSE